MRKSELIERLEEIEGDPEVYIDAVGKNYSNLVGNMYVDSDGDIILEP